MPPRPVASVRFAAAAADAMRIFGRLQPPTDETGALPLAVGRNAPTVALPFNVAAAGDVVGNHDRRRS